jgi:hypothetical protein
MLSDVLEQMQQQQNGGFRKHVIISKHANLIFHAANLGKFEPFVRDHSERARILIMILQSGHLTAAIPPGLYGSNPCWFSPKCVEAHRHANQAPLAFAAKRLADLLPSLQDLHAEHDILRWVSASRKVLFQGRQSRGNSGASRLHQARLTHLPEQVQRHGPIGRDALQQLRESVQGVSAHVQDQCAGLGTRTILLLLLAQQHRACMAYEPQHVSSGNWDV